MPLHLLGKKSWNVYNTAAIERVRRDEAQAQAREEADEQRMQDEDAKRRIALLRGDAVPYLPDTDLEEASSHARSRSSREDKPRTRRKLRGEDDTDAEIRLARQDAEAGKAVRLRLGVSLAASDAPLQDRAGHFQLLPKPDDRAARKAEINAEAEAEKAKRRKREEDKYMMKFSNAAGININMAQPWYAARDQDNVALPGKDAWGDADPRRKYREQNRVVSNDPFAVMQRAQVQLKQNSKDREQWQSLREKELQGLKEADRRERKKRKQRRREYSDGLDGFKLNMTRRLDRHTFERRQHRDRRRSNDSREPDAPGMREV